MNDISSVNGVFVTRESIRSLPGDDLVVYVGVTPMAPQEIVAQLKSFLERYPGKFGAICVVAPAFRDARVAAVIACDDFVQFKTRHGVEAHSFLFGRDGRIQGTDDTRRKGMLRRILTNVVRSRHGVLGGSGAVHYGKPSKKHSDQFIRTANVLVNSVEVEMIAWGCLPHFTNDVGFVYTDTGAINCVATSVRDLLVGFHEPANFSVDSFGSYKGLDTFAGAKVGSIWLVSATTSGNLEQMIVDKQGVALEQIVCIFSLGVRGKSDVCHLDLDEHHNPQGFGPIKSYPPNACNLCRAGSTPLWLTDEQFLVSDIAVTSYLPKRDDLLTETGVFLRELVGNNVFRVSYELNPVTECSDIFLDVEPLAGQMLSAEASASGLAARFKRRIQQSLPAAVDAIVHLDDPASTTLALALSSYVKSRGPTPTLIAARDLASTAFDTSPETVVVLASTVASGTSVIDVSRTLRPISTVKSISYFVLVDRSPTEKRARETLQSVTTTEDGHRYDYHVTVRLPLPDPSEVTRNAWEQETDLLHRLLESCPNGDLRTKLEQRRDSLDAAKSDKQRGLQVDLFWPSENNENLVLSPGFVFLPKEFDALRASEADVYSIIRCLLHSLRTKGRDGKEPALRQHPLHRKVLDVSVFYRFNDSMLQAAMLRAAAPAELDYSYSGTKDQSASARLLLVRMFKDQTAPATEFALALAVGRLRISEDDKKQVLDEVDALPPLASVTRAFLDEWKSR